MASNYTEASIKTLGSLEHIRLCPGMYIGRLGNGARAEDGIYVRLKQTIDMRVTRPAGGFCQSPREVYVFGHKFINGVKRVLVHRPCFCVKRPYLFATSVLNASSLP